MTDRVSQRVVLMASSEGGMDIEEVAESHPELIHKVAIDPAVGLTDADADDIAAKIGMPAASHRRRPRAAARACTRLTGKPMRRWPKSTR